MLLDIQHLQLHFLLIWTLTFSISSFTNLQIPSICQKSVWNSTCCKLVPVARLCWWTRLVVLPAGPLVVFRRASHSWANQQTSFSRRWNPYIPTRAGHAEFFHKPICVSVYMSILYDKLKKRILHAVYAYIRNNAEDRNIICGLGKYMRF